MIKGFKIKDARVYHLSLPIEHPVKTAFGTIDTRHAVLLELTDEEGHTGLGDSWINFPKWAPWERQAAFEHACIPYLKGRTCDDVRYFITEMAHSLRGSCVQSQTISLMVQALCAVELALWDLAAKVQNVPLNKLLFTDPAPSVRIYASGLTAPLPWKTIDQCLEAGIKVFKLKIGFGAEDTRNLTDLTKYFGDSARIAVDINRSFTFEQASEWLDQLRDFNVLWMEEPLRPEEEHRMVELADKNMVPLAGGENVLIEPGYDDPRKMADLPLDIFQPDITKYCCLSDALELLEVLKLRGKKLYPHCFGAAPAQVACLHLAAGCGDVYQEMDITPNALRTDLFSEPIDIKNGAVRLPDAPGLGWELNPRMVEKLSLV